MKNIILDTNAFIYLTNIEYNKHNTICIEGKHIDDKKFYNYCINANHLFVTGQTLYELFWQSIEKTNSINEFAQLYDTIAKFRRIYEVSFSILNDKDGEFELSLFEKQFKNGNVDIKYFIEQKRKYEIKKLERLVFTLYASVMGIILDYSKVDFGELYFKEIKDIIYIALDEISQKYYIDKKKNEDYDFAIDWILGEILKSGTDICREKAAEWKVKLPNVKGDKGGALLINNLFCKLRQNKYDVITQYDIYLDDICNILKANKEYAECIEYLKYICYRCIHCKAKIRKNDGIDFSIISCLAKDIIEDQTKGKISLNDICVITFDKNLYRFTKEKKILYNKAVYEDLLM